MVTVRIAQSVLTTRCIFLSLLLFLSMPLGESDQVPGNWFRIIYYVLIVFVAGLSGLAVSIVLMLLNAVTSLIDMVRPSTDEDVDDAKEREEKESDRKKYEIDEKGGD